MPHDNPFFVVCRRICRGPAFSVVQLGLTAWSLGFFLLGHSMDADFTVFFFCLRLWVSAAVESVY